MQKSATVLAKTLLAGAAAAALQACGSSDRAAASPDASEPKSVLHLRSEISLARPLSGGSAKALSGSTTVASGSIYDNGNLVLDTSALTAQAARQLRIEAQGCADQANALSCAVLSAIVNPDDASTITGVNVRSTLVERLVRLKGMQQAAAEQRVSNYLMLDAATTSQQLVDQNLFSPARFVSDNWLAAQSKGLSLDQQIGQLVDSIAADATLQRQYKPLLTIAPIVATIGIELVKGALGKIGGEAMGSVLSKIGLNTDAANHTAVMNELKGIASQLSAMSQQLSTVESAVKQTMAKVEEVSKKVDDVAQQQRALRLLTQTSQLLALVEKVKRAYWDLQNLPQVSATQQAAEVKRLLAVIESIQGDRAQISAALNGTPGNSSMVATMVDFQFPKVAVPDYNKEVFLNQKTLKSMSDFVQYYDNVNLMAYYLIMEFYNYADPASATQSCPETLSSGVSYTLQCMRYQELKQARADYISQGPQETLPVPSMFVNVYQGYTAMPWVLYPAGDFNYQSINGVTPDAGSFLARQVYPDLTAQQQSEVTAMANWDYMKPVFWYGMFARPAVSGTSQAKVLKDVAIANGAPTEAFYTASLNLAAWVRTTDSGPQAFNRVSTTTGSLDVDQNKNPRTTEDAKLIVLGQFKSRAVLERYLGKVMAARFTSLN